MTNKDVLIASHEGGETVVLPSIIRTTSGVEIDPSQDVWQWRDNVNSIHINFISIKGVEPAFLLTLKYVLSMYAENKSVSHLSNMFDRICHLLKFLCESSVAPISTITHIDLINYRAALDDSNSWYMSSLAGILKKWYDLGVPGVTTTAKALLVQLRLKGNLKGKAVLTMDPNLGPFTDIELQAISSAVNDAYAAGVVDIDKYLLLWLFILLGQRPIQYAALKACDVIMGKAKDGSTCYSLRVPRAKQKDHISREEFKDRLLIPQIGELLVQYAVSIKHKFKGVLADPEQAPLFPQKKHAATAPNGFEYHQTSTGISAIIRN
jgi:hypothetical protein